MTMKITLLKMDCKRCQHTWIPKKEEVRICPKCKSPYFDRERKHGNDNNPNSKREI